MGLDRWVGLHRKGRGQSPRTMSVSRDLGQRKCDRDPEIMAMTPADPSAASETLHCISRRQLDPVSAVLRRFQWLPVVPGIRTVLRQAAQSCTELHQVSGPPPGPSASPPVRGARALFLRPHHVPSFTSRQPRSTDNLARPVLRDTLPEAPRMASFPSSGPP